ncbi:hypothetical protein BG015_004921, partial [Linnemannia schmuckeri]
IEKALIEGDIQVADVPAVWNAKMKEYFGLEVPEHSAGCLQDIHWSSAAIGYFPTYTLGSIYAVQIFDAAKEAIPGLEEHLKKGEFHVLKEWLNKNVHEQGSLRESGDELVLALTALLKDAAHIYGISDLLKWDQLVTMPKKAEDARSNQTSPVLGALLEELERRRLTEDLSFVLNPYELANIRLAHKAYRSLLNASAKPSGAWVEARKESSFFKFAPFLEGQVRLIHQSVFYKIKGGIYEEARKINKKARASLGLPDEDECYKGYYQKGLIPFIAKIAAENFQHENAFIKGDFDIKKQTEFSHKFPTQMEFDMDAGRLDESTHLFCSNAHLTDVRLTTRYALGNFQEGITSTIHDTGHALYEQGRNKEYLNTPVSQLLSIVLHGSQSLLRERMVLLSKPFWTYTLPLLKNQFADHDNFRAVTVDQFYLAFNRVEPTLIRLEADELTYPMHIILRYEIEKALIEGEIDVADIPALWNAKMKEYLGLDVTEDRLGCLQNIHWSVGIMDYFPTCTLGSIYAVQIYTQAKEEIPDLDDHLVKGDLLVLKEWLNKNVHEQGSLHESGDILVFHLTGKPLGGSFYVKYLIDKYTTIYNL